MAETALERRFCEVRAEGRTLVGVGVRYGSVAAMPWGEERIDAGAFAPVGDVILNLQHDRARALARTPETLRIEDTPTALRVEASLPATRDAEDALTLIRAGVLRGLSVEFRVRQERTEGALRIIQKAHLVGIGLVDTPAYRDSEVAARAVAPPRPHLRWWR